MQSGNDAKFLNITSLFLSSNRIAAASIPVPVIFIVSFTSHNYICITVDT